MATTNAITAITPDIWSAVLQDNLKKSLVGYGVANIDARPGVNWGNVINKSYFTVVTAAAYTPGTDVSLDDLSFTNDTLTVNRNFYTASYVDDIEQLQSNVSIQRALLDDATYQIGNIIDGEILGNVSAG